MCRIVDYGKFKYEQAKQKKSDKPKKREKEVKFRVNIDPHDYAIKMMHAEDFLAHGFKVRIQLQFKGRQMAHKELGFDLMEKIKVDLSGMAHIDLEPKLNNRNILMMVSPLPPRSRSAASARTARNSTSPRPRPRSMPTTTMTTTTRITTTRMKTWMAMRMTIPPTSPERTIAKTTKRIKVTS